MSLELEVKKCGECLVHEHVTKDHKQIMTMYINSNITPYEGIKQSYNDYDGTGPSEEDISNNGIQNPNIIQRLMLLLGIWIESLCSR